MATEGTLQVNGEIVYPQTKASLVYFSNNRTVQEVLGDGYLYMGLATPSTNPGTITGKVFYIANTPGTYTNFNNFVLTNGVYVLKYDGTGSLGWVSEKIMDTVSVSQNASTGHTDINIGNVAYPVASVEELSQLGQEVILLDESVVQGFGGEYIPYMDIEQGAIASVTGTDTDSTTRIRTHNYIKGGVISITMSGNKVYVMGYKNDNTYVGARGWLTESQEVRIPGADKYRFVFAYSNDSTITPADYSSLNIEIKIKWDGEFADKQQTQLGKVDIAYINLVDESKVEQNKAIYIYNGAYDIRTEQTSILTDYIPVFGKNIISNAIASAYWGGAVYDSNKDKIRTFGTAQYTYQEGDYYIRLTLSKSKLPIANYGTVLGPYTEYNPILGYLKTINSDIATINSALSSVELASEQNPHPIHFVSGNINLSTGVDAIGASDIRTTDYLPCSGTAPQIFVAKDGHILNVFNRQFYYNSEKQYIGYTSGSATTASYYRIVIYNYTDTADLLVYIDNDSQGREDFVMYMTEDYYKNLNETDEIEIGYTKKVAKGLLSSDGSYSDELAASPIVNENNNFFNVFVATDDSNKRGDRDYETLNVVAINHDDMPYSDIVGNRTIYNKYDFHANFNLILYPFTSLLDKSIRIQNIKELVGDGHDLGLHAILNKSYWATNKLFDIRPDSTFTFAPILGELTGPNVDGTGTNAFGVNVTATTKAGSMYLNLPSSVDNPNIVDMTAAQLIEITRCFSLYADYKYTVTGLDLNDERVTKTVLGWLEYWYNNLIDSSLGYSSEETVIADRFAEDYEYASGGSIGDYYPDVSHLKNGRIVFFDDTMNPNYSDSSYQKVGRFTKGLFKGCASCCNYEVADIVISIAEAVIKHYYGVSHFNSQNTHGIGYFNGIWYDQETGNAYADRDKAFLLDFQQKQYLTKDGKWQSYQDIYLKHNIRYTNYGEPNVAYLEGQVGLYYGQKGIRSDFFNNIVFESGGISYLNFFGSNESETMNYSNFSTFLNGQENWIKFAYEKAGTSVTNNEKTYTVFSRIKHFIDVIRACSGTGKIPVFSYDTIMINPSISTAIDLICRYCYENNIKIVPTEKARLLATSYKLIRNGNVIPNPSFNQSVLRYFGGTSTSPEAYVPDGWSYGGKLSSITISSEQLAEALTAKTLSLSAGNSSAYLQTRIYGLEPGTYRLSIYSKSSTNNGVIEFFIKKNKDYINQFYREVSRFSAIKTFYAGPLWTLYTYEFTIAENEVHEYDGTDPANVLAQGHEDNVSNVILKITAQSSGTIAISKPSIIRITS